MELMIVQSPDYLEATNPHEVIRQVYHCYAFRDPQKMEKDDYLINVRMGNAISPISRNHFYDNTLDPIRGRAKTLWGSVTLNKLEVNGKNLDFYFVEVPLWVYSFSLWPDETWNFSRSLFNVFTMMTGRMDLNLTEAEFEKIRSDLGHDGFTMREVERWPYHPPQSVK